MQQVWDNFLSIMREEAGSRVVETWFKAIRFVSWNPENKEVVLEAPNKFICDWVKLHHGSNFRVHLGRLLHVQDPRVTFLDARGASQSTQSTQETGAVAVVPARLVRTSSTVRSSTVRNAIVPGGVNNEYQFETFVVGPSNEFAHAAARAAAETPGTKYNPLFIYGGSGLGKTHLLHAIGNEVRKRHKSATVLYETTDRFVNDFINAIRYDKIERFQKRHQAADVLLIDDVQFIGRKEQTQEAFFHIFNILYDAHKQIVFTSDAFPQEMVGVADRLRSRFAWGLVADIHMPQIETRIAILRKKAALNRTVVPDDVIEFIASHPHSNVRELEGALVRVVAAASLMGEAVDLALAQTILGSQRTSASREVNLDQIARGVCKQFSFTLDQLRSRARNKELAHARHIAVFLMKRLTGHSLRDIAAFLGGRDHSTLVHALDRVKGLMGKDSDFSVRMEQIERDILRLDY